MYSLISIDDKGVYYVEYWGAEFYPTLLKFNSKDEYEKWVVGKCEL